jgi:transcriptional antiterminator RfaH
MKNWYVIHALPNQEFRAKLNLKRQNYFVYLPQYLGTRKHARKVEKILKPLFPQYLFIQLDLLHENISSINSTFGVNKIVALGDDPSIIPNVVIKNLMDKEDNKGNLDCIANFRFKIGENVKIEDGVLKGNNAVFMGINENQRVSVLLSMMGRKLNISMPSLSLQAS